MKKGRVKSLRVFFLLFLGRTLFYVMLATAVWSAAVLAIVQTQLLLPANRTERELSDWLADSAESVGFLMESFPETAGYLLYSADGVRESRRLSGEEEKKAGELYFSGTESSNSAFGAWQYRRYELSGSVMIVHYPMRAVFRDAALRRCFPYPEPLLLGILLAGILTAVFFSIVRAAKRMAGEAQKLERASLEIGKRNLDFTVEQTSIYEFNRVLAALDALKESLTSSLESQWRLEQEKKRQMSALAHDIKTPLTVIGGNIQLLQETALDKEQQEYAASVLRSTEQIRTYVGQIIALSKDRTAAVARSEIRTAEFFAELAEEARRLARKKRISIETVYGELPETFFSDKEALRRAFLNLLENAVQYTPEQGGISCAAQLTQKGLLEVCISDTGCGFSAEALKLAKTAFYRAETDRGGGEHFGMGLSIADGILTALGGSLLLENSREGGACVTVLLNVR